MCGLVAILLSDGAEVEVPTLRRMRDTLTHRGPDGRGIWASGAAGLGHTRLSILDLSEAGHQPMTNEDGTLHLVFNGEIYNFPELRSSLIANGHEFRSHSDSEVLLHLYEEEGPSCVRRLRGMFAFVIHDARTGQLFGARDRTGIKPLHYLHDARGFSCASEIKALLADPSTPCREDPRGIADYLFCGQPLGGRTFFEGIRSLPPGHSFVTDGTRLRVESYWELEFNYRHDRPFSAVVGELSERLQDSVKVHCLSDAPLGAHLSGGLDSSTVAALAAKDRADALPAFAIRFNGGAYFDESSYASAAASYCGANLHVATPAEDGLQRMFRPLLWHLDQPVPGDPGYSYAAAARLAAQHVKVSLTGHGGDEVFAGYPAQFLTTFGNLDAFGRRGETSDRSAEARGVRLRRLLRSEGFQGVTRRLGLSGSGWRDGLTEAERRWISLHCGYIPAENPFLSSRFKLRLADHSPVDEYIEHFRHAPTDSLLDKCLHHDLRTYLPQLLHKEDRASMAVSLESRVPLLDHELLEFLATVPAEQKVPAGEPKGLLRAAARQWLPEQVTERRDKSPFPVPTRRWMAGPLGDELRRILAEDRTKDRGIFHTRELSNPSLDHDMVLTMANVELWFRTFIDGEGPGSALPVADGEWWAQPILAAAR